MKREYLPMYGQSQAPHTHQLQESEGDVIKQKEGRVEIYESLF
jgi:hypothetical protein